MSNSFFLIINPASRSGRSQGDCKKIISLLEKRGVSFDFKWTKGPSDAIELARQAAKKNYDAVVAVGGDGTICEIISGLFTDNENGPRPKLGILHTGTSPDFNRYHKIPTALKDAVQILLQGKTKSVDIGKITYYLDPKRENKTVSYFASNVNLGLGPQIARRSNSHYRKYLGDLFGTLSSTIVSLVGFKKMDLKIDMDGEKMNLDGLINLTVGKDPYLASGMRILSEISPADGRLYVLSIGYAPLPVILGNIPRLYIGNFLEYRGAKIRYAKKVEIDYCPTHPWIEFDGDVKGYLPASIEVLEKALEVIVPLNHAKK